MSDIKVGDMVYDCEAPQDTIGRLLLGWVIGGADNWWIVEWSDGCILDCYSNKLQEMKKEYKKLQRGLTAERK